MINRKYKCIFIEVPKTGSTSIRSLVGSPKYPHLDIKETIYNIKHFLPFYNLRYYKYVNYIYKNILPTKTRNSIGENIIDEYFKFGIVRNPWSRTVSLYNRKEGIQMRNKMSFEEFVNWINYSSDTCIYPSRKLNQLDWFKDSNGKLFVDFIGKFESLNKDWEHISEILGILDKLPHKNKNTSRKHYSEYYNSKTKEIIRKKFLTDIEYFEYEFK